jgi:hypothetical protein
MKIDAADLELRKCINKIWEAQGKFISAYRQLGGENPRRMKDSFDEALADYEQRIQKIRAKGY